MSNDKKSVNRIIASINQAAEKPAKPKVDFKTLIGKMQAIQIAPAPITVEAVEAQKADADLFDLYTTANRVMKCQYAPACSRWYAGMIYSAILIQDLTKSIDEDSDIKAVTGLSIKQFNKLKRVYQWFGLDTNENYTLYLEFVNSIVEDSKGFAKALGKPVKAALKEGYDWLSELRKTVYGAISNELANGMPISQKAAVTLAVKISEKCSVSINSNTRAKYFNGQGIQFGEIASLDELIKDCLIVAKPLSVKKSGLDEKVVRSWNNYLIKENPYKQKLDAATTSSVADDCV